MPLVESLKNAYLALEDAYYNFMEALQNKGVPVFDFFVKPLEEKGIPSFPVFALILVALVVGAFIVLSPPAGKTVAIQVFANGTGVSEALVELELDGKTIAMKETVGGKVVFQNVPSSRLKVRVSKKGLAEAQKYLSEAATTLRFELGGGPTKEPESVQLVVLDKESQTPVEGAKVRYTMLEGSGDEITNASGKATLPKSALLNIKVSKDGYKTDVLTVRGGGDVTVHLQKISESVLFASKTSNKVSVIVSVKNESGQPVDASVSLYSTDRTKQGEADAVDGEAIIEAEEGVSAYVVAKAEGYGLYDGSGEPKIVREGAVFRVILSSFKGQKTTVIKAVDAEGKSISFKAKIIKPPSLVLAENEGNEWSLEVLPGDYALWVGAEGFLPQSLTLKIGETNVARLEKSTPFNSGTLTVFVKDEYEAAVTAKVLLQKNNLPIYPPSTAEEGKTVFQNVPLGTVKILAFVKGGEGAAEASVAEGDNEATVRVNAHNAFVNVTVRDALANKPLVASLKTQALGNLVEETSGSSATLKAKAVVETKLIVSATGYLTHEASLLLADGETKAVDVALIPEGAVRGAKVAFASIKDLQGKIVEKVVPGGDYIVEINATPAPSAQNMSLYLRVGSDFASIIEFSNADVVLKSTTYTPGEECVDLSASSVSGSAFNWVELHYSTPASRSVSFIVRVNAAAQSNQDLSLFYRTASYAADIAARDPPDAKNNPCYAEAYEQKVPVVEGAAPLPGASPTPPPTSEFRLPEAQFTGPLNISYNPATGKVDVGVDQIVLQVDSIYSKDVVPLNYDDQNCRIEAKFESKYPLCFSLSRKALEFKTQEYNTGCTAKVKGNKVIIPEGDNFLVLQASCAATTSLTKIQVFVKTQEATSITIAPSSLDGGQNTAKLLYVINQKQAGGRALTPLGGAGTINAPEHSATSLAWSGPGTLTLMEEDETIGEWTYNQETAYFKGIGAVGQRVESCSDYLCCAQGWCTAKALLQAVQDFKQKAVQTAQATAFRRGTGQSEKPFVFSTVAQAGENADKVLEQTGFKLERPPTCTANKPGVYILQASSNDGKTFSFSGSTAKLTQNLDDPANVVWLCNFIYANKKDIVGPQASKDSQATQPSQVQDKSKNPNPASQDLADPLTSARPEQHQSRFLQAVQLAKTCEGALSKAVANPANKDAEPNPQAPLKGGSCPRLDVIEDRQTKQGKLKIQKEKEQVKLSAYNTKKGEIQTEGETINNEYTAIIGTYATTCTVTPGQPAHLTTTDLIKNKQELQELTIDLQICGSCFTKNTQLSAYCSACTTKCTAQANKANAFTGKFNSEFKKTTTDTDDEVSKRKNLELELKEVAATCKNAERACRGGEKPTPKVVPEVELSPNFPRQAQFHCFVKGKPPKGDDEERQTVEATYRNKDTSFTPIPIGGVSAAPSKALAFSYEPTLWFLGLTSTSETSTSIGGVADSVTGSVEEGGDYGCTALCEPQDKCVETFFRGPQLVAYVHFGLTTECEEKMQASAIPSMIAPFISSGSYGKLGAYAGYATLFGQNSCNGAKSAFDKGNLGGPGGFQPPISPEQLKQLQKPSPSPSPSPSPPATSTPTATTLPPLPPADGGTTTVKGKACTKNDECPIASLDCALTSGEKPPNSILQGVCGEPGCQCKLTTAKLEEPYTTAVRKKGYGCSFQEPLWTCLKTAAAASSRATPTSTASALIGSACATDLDCKTLACPTGKDYTCLDKKCACV